MKHAVLAALFACLWPTASMADESTGADAFALCAACHLRDGNGLPGAFPPIRNRLGAIAALPGGRDYLIAVSLFGLAGPIDVGGQTYNGFMVGQQNSLDSQTLAGALNHATFELVDDGQEQHDGEKFSADEIDAVALKMPDATPQDVAKLRAEVMQTEL